jgi:CRISPR-associated protein Csm4
LTHEIHDALTLLGESGIGGERSYGLGQFTPMFGEATDDLGSKGGEYFTSLAPYLPQPSEWEVFGPGAAYDIQLRRGWISMPEYTHLRRPTVRMVGAGAILVRPKTGDVIGSMADATPSVLEGKLAIRRYGIAWPVPVAAAAVEAQ